MIPFKNLNEHVKEMKDLGEILIPYNFPFAKQEVENEIQILKTRDIIVDGYEITVCYSKADYKEKFCLSLQIVNVCSMFLPFRLLVKIAKEFLGENNLYLTDIYRENRKLYCWTCWRDLDNNSIEYDGKSEKLYYQDFEYNYVDSKDIMFY